jgi:hypothetical protein
MALEAEVSVPTTAKTLYTCPMHPQIEQDHAGKCPICGMAVEPKNITAADEEETTEPDDMTRRFWIGGECLTKSPLHLLPVPSPKNGPDCFTVLSTVGKNFAAKLRNSAQRRANPKSRKHLASAMVRKPVKTHAKTLP